MYKKNFLKLNYLKTIKQVMKQMTDRGSHYAILVNKKNQLMGIITDGDLRRSLINKIDIDKKIATIMNKKPKFVHIDNLKNISVLNFNEKYRYIPVIDNNKNIYDILDLEEQKKSTNILDKKICIIGMGFVGLTLSLVMANNGYLVYGYDKNKSTISKLKKNKSPFYEKGLDDYLKKLSQKKIFFHNNLNKINPDVYIITVGTPLLKNGLKPDISAIKKVSTEISNKIKKNDLVILRSTVPVGTTRKIVKNIIEKRSKLKCGLDFSLSFAPERTVEGDALNEITSLPQIIGSFDKKSLNFSDEIFSEFTKNIIKVENIESAEMIKIINNTFRDVKFAYANEIALISKNLNLDVSELIKAANKGYPRDSIPFPSPGVGGPCLPKDSKILSYSIKNSKSHANLISIARKVNESIIPNIFNEIKTYFKSTNKDILKAKFFFMGIAFKGNPETSDFRGSNAIELINLLKKNFNLKNIFVYDPVIKKNDILKLGLKNTTIDKGFKNSDVILIMNNHISFQKIKINQLLKSSKNNCLLFDGWSVFDKKQFNLNKNIKYLSVGSKK